MAHRSSSKPSRLQWVALGPDVPAGTTNLLVAISGVADTGRLELTSFLVVEDCFQYTGEVLFGHAFHWDKLDWGGIKTT